MRVDPGDLLVFASVAETLSFREAANRLHFARSSISKRVSYLERELGVVLFNRSTRRISLTDAGRRLYRHWQSISREIDNALVDIQGVDDVPTGTLRISVPSTLGSSITPALVRSFLPAHPELSVKLDFRDSFVDIVGQSFDAVIRVVDKLPDSRLVAKRLATTEFVLAAAPAYLDERGQPKTLQDLSAHQCMALGFQAERTLAWPMVTRTGSVRFNVEPTFAASNDLVLILAACLGGGIVHMPRILIENELAMDRLRVIELEDARGQENGVYAIYPQANPPAKVRVFVEFMVEQLSRLDQLDRWSPLGDR